MADELDFREQRHAVPNSNKELPVLKRTEKAEIGSTPNFQSETERYAKATNWMSGIGATVAQAASNKIAEDLGVKLGKDPHGDIGFAITDFDKHLIDTYNTQSQATLGLQASKLITESNIKLASSPRLSPQLIESTQRNVALGLQNIYKNAPTQIQPQLEHQYGQQQLRQLESLNDRMISEQRRDWRDNAVAISKENAEQSYSASIRGDRETANQIIKNTKNINDTALKNKVITPEEHKVNIEAVKKNAEGGALIHMYEQAKDKEDFLKEIADNAPKALNADPHYLDKVHVLMTYIQSQDALRQRSESLTMARFSNTLVTDMNAAATMLPQLESELSPIHYQETLLKYFRALKQNQANLEEQSLLNGGWNNTATWVRTSEKAKNETYDEKARYIVEESQKNGNPISLDKAQAMVAAQAAGPVPRFTEEINSKMNSTDPVAIESAGKQIDYMYDHHKGGNLAGVTDKAKAMWENYSVLKRNNPPDVAAKIAHESSYFLKEGEANAIEDNWKDFKKVYTPQGSSLKFYSKMAGFSPSEITDPLGFQEQSEYLMHRYFVVNRGNIESTKKMWLRDVQSSYGATNVNGSRQVTYFPLEKIYDLPSSDDPVYSKHSEEVPYLFKGVLKELDVLNNVFNKRMVPYSSVGLIQENIIDSVNKQLMPIKESYDQGKSLDYWEFEPRPSIAWSKENKDKFDPSFQSVDNLRKYSDGSPIIIHHVWRNGTRDTYTITTKANPFLTQLNNGSSFVGAWDIVLTNKDGGNSSLAILAGQLNREVYFKPDVESTRAKYMKYYGDQYGK